MPLSTRLLCGAYCHCGASAWCRVGASLGERACPVLFWVYPRGGGSLRPRWRQVDPDTSRNPTNPSLPRPIVCTRSQAPVHPVSLPPRPRPFPTSFGSKPRKQRGNWRWRRYIRRRKVSCEIRSGGMLRPRTYSAGKAGNRSPLVPHGVDIFREWSVPSSPISRQIRPGRSARTRSFCTRSGRTVHPETTGRPAAARSAPVCTYHTKQR